MGLFHPSAPQHRGRRQGSRRRQQQGGVHRHGGGVAGLHRLGGGHLHRQLADGTFVARPVHGLGIHRRGGGGEGAGIQHPLRAVIAVVQGHVLLGGGQGHLSVAALGDHRGLGGRGILHHGEGHGGGGAGSLIAELHRHHILALLQLRTVGEHLGDGIAQNIDVVGGIDQNVAVDLQTDVAEQMGYIAGDGEGLLVGADHRAVGDARVVKAQGRGLRIRQVVQIQLGSTGRK